MIIERMAFKAIRPLRQEHHDACLELPQLLRAHGLSAALGYWLADRPTDVQGDPTAAQCQRAVAAAFIDALHRLCPIAPPDQMAQQLVREPHEKYLLHSRLAIELADAWAMMARALLAAEGAPTFTALEAPHAEAEA